MPGHEIKCCPRCGSDFECCVSSITKCQCNDVTIDADLAEALSLHYGDCLCYVCLTTLASASTRDPHQNQSVSGNIRSFARVRRKRA